MIKLQEMAVLIAYMVYNCLVDLKNQLLLISFFLLLCFMMHHIATHNMGLGSYNDFNRLMSVSTLLLLIIKDHIMFLNFFDALFTNI